MVYYKRVILQVTTTGTTQGSGSTKVVLPEGYYTVPKDVYLGWTGTSGTGTIIKPDLDVIYNIKINLNSEINDWGFFEPYLINDALSGTTNDADYINFEKKTCAVTGYSSSRLNELRKHSPNLSFEDAYIPNGSPVSDGVDYNNSISGVCMTYYIGGIKYIDYFDDDDTITKFCFITNGVSSDNFINKPIYKDPNKEFIVDRYKLDSDVFIVRQSLSVFEDNYKLENIKNMSDLLTYASGNYFKIYKNV